jgi:hypothetical protein
VVVGEEEDVSDEAIAGILSVRATDDPGRPIKLMIGGVELRLTTDGAVDLATALLSLAADTPENRRRHGDAAYINSDHLRSEESP